MDETTSMPPLEPEAGDVLDELFSDLTDQRPQHAPIAREEKIARVRRLGEILADNSVDALLVEPGKTLEYLSDLSWGTSERLFALVVLADGSSFWVVPSFEATRAQARIAAAGGPEGKIIGWDEHEYAFAPLASELRARGVERIAVEPRCRAFVHTRLGTAFGADRVLSGDAIVAQLRGTKDAHELALLRTANELTQQAICAVAERLPAGTTDHQLGAMMRRAQERLGLSSVWVLPLIGPDAALPHGGPTGRSITKGDLILVDTGGSFQGYQSDNTRTWSFDGPPTADALRGWNTVRDAQKRAYEAMRPGVACGDIDRAARAVIEGAGYGQGYAAFSHRLGHGIGLEGHEEPYLDGGNKLLLAAGMTFSDEPGIYLPGRFGIRLEDIVVVTEDGADHFGSWQVSPTSPA
ncbi:MAG: Xaa-Pro dipeptidase [Gammaproteobacteria bacterium]|jgi:Xaa-Pro dipeptidase